MGLVGLEAASLGYLGQRDGAVPVLERQQNAHRQLNGLDALPLGN